MKYRLALLILASAIGTVLAVAGLSGLTGVGQPAVEAAGTVRYVAKGGKDTGACTSPSAPCASPQYAVNQSLNGDEIRIARGVYSSSIGGAVLDFAGRSLDVRGGFVFNDPGTNWTTPDPVSNPVTLTTAPGIPTVMAMYVVSGSLTDLRISGGGVRVLYGPTMIVSRTIFTGNVANGLGGALEVQGSQVSVHNSQFFNNRSSNGFSAQRGGAIAAGSGSTLLVTGSQFSGNGVGLQTLSTYQQASYGGAIDVLNSTADIVGSTFISNTATGVPGATGPGGATGYNGGDAYGGAISAWTSVLTITGSHFESNGAFGGRGGDGGSAVVSVGNGGVGGEGGLATGGAVGVYSGTTFLSNNTFLSNTAAAGPGGTGGNSGFGGGNGGAGGNTNATALGRGGGLATDLGRFTLIGARFAGNSATGGAGGRGGNGANGGQRGPGGDGGSAAGGAVWASQGPENIAIGRSVIVENQAAGGPGGLPGLTGAGGASGAAGLSTGGGVSLERIGNVAGPFADFANLAILDNQAGSGAGLTAYQSRLNLLHATINQNAGASGLLVRTNTVPASVTGTNLLVAGQVRGVHVIDGNAASGVRLNGILFSTNTTDTENVPPAAITNRFAGSPAFQPDGFHIRPGSAAIDRGVATFVTVDVDGTSRPRGAAADLGAVEAVPPGAGTIAGPATGQINTGYRFTATVQPPNTTLPLTVTWHATDLPSTTASSASISTSVTLSWAVSGTKTVTATVIGASQPLVLTRTVQINAPFVVLPPGVIDRVGATNGFVRSLSRKPGGGNTLRSRLAGEDPIYGGGDFTEAGGQTVNYIAQLDPITLGWNSVGGGTNGPVLALAASASTLYAGGNFSQAGGGAASFVAQYTGVAGWNSMSGGTNGPVNALAVGSTAVYAGGAFSQAGGQPASNIAQYDPVTSGWNSMSGGMNGPVNALAVSGGATYAGGAFTEAGGSAASNIAMWNGVGWNSLSGGGPNGPVFAVAINGNQVIVGGAFSQVAGVPANNIASYDSATGVWSALGAGTNGAVQALEVQSGIIYLGGSFTQAGGQPVGYVAMFDGAVYSALDEGTNAPVFAIEGNGSAVFLGGAFTQAGGLPAGFVTRYGVERVIKPVFILSPICVQCQPGW